MDTLFTDALRQLLGNACSTDTVRAIERGEPHAALWQTIEASGFADAMRSEAHGGAGLSLDDAIDLIGLCGEFALPVPLADTLLARALLDMAGIEPPTGAIVLATAQQQPDGSWICERVRSARTADHVLAVIDGATALLPVDAAQSQPAAFVLDARLHWPADVVGRGMLRPAQSSKTLSSRDALRHIEALLCAALISGALQRVLAQTLAYANQRVQFGKPIGKFQAVQHQLSLMAEHVFAARMSAALAARGASLAAVDRLRVAVAKARCSEAALEVASLAHSIHGAIGFTEAFDLQLSTRRLHVWRHCAGAESYWHDQLGAALLARPASPALDLLRELS